MKQRIFKLDIKVELLSGLHIGGSHSTFDIGGADSSVIKNPITMEPYIPGSSLKGKLRALLTYRMGEIYKGDILLTDSTVASIFAPQEKEGNVSITRGIFRDLYLSEESKELLASTLGNGIYTEIKAENRINKLKGTAESPRFIERVPAGVSFEGEIILMVFEKDDVEKMKTTIIEALNLLELNYLGGSGTRGYGRVKVVHGDFKEV